MKTIKDLTIKVTYKVRLGNVKVPEKVHDQLNDVSEIDGTGFDHPEAVEWLRNNIRQRDCWYLEYEIEELS